MKLTFAIIVLAAIPLSAQTRLLVGASGGESYSNTFLGVDAGIEQPLGHRLELDAQESYSPFEWHTGLGHGWANQVSGGGIGWLRPNFGLAGSVEDSRYSVTRLAKSSTFGTAGVIFRSRLGGSPLRVSLNYVRQLLNGIDRRGVETNHLQAAEFRLEGRIGCKGPVCFRSLTEFSVGGLENQGNPECDGEWGRATCPRRYHLSGSGYAGFAVEFPRPKDPDAAF